MSLPLAIDIETVPQRAWRDPEVVAPPADLEDYDADGNVIEQIEQGQCRLARTGQLPACHPTTAQIVSITMGWMSRDGDAIETKTLQASNIVDPEKWDTFTEDQQLDIEREILRNTWPLFCGALGKGMTIVTFNGKGFDLPMMRWRSAILGVSVPQLSWYELLYPYRHKEHIDLRLLFSDGDRRARGTLSMWAQAFGVHCREAGHLVLDWVLAGDWPELKNYGDQEMHTLIQLHRKVGLL